MTTHRSLHPQTNGLPSVLLTMADYYGTLAAVRCFGRAGIPVTIAESRHIAPAKWSKYVTRRIACPPFEKKDDFLGWLKQFGTENPGYFIYPTSDDMAWLLASHWNELSGNFISLLPDQNCMYALLNKRKLHPLLEECGLSGPQTWFPNSLEDLDKLAPQLEYPVLIKPQTQVDFDSHVKGRIVHKREDLQNAYLEFMQQFRYGPSVVRIDADVKWPMIQRYYPEAMEGIYSISGYVDATGERVCFRGERKVLQRPRRMGIGLCFESEPVYDALAQQLVALCRRLGYAGVFEVEFIEERATKRFLLTDFNPRFYSQMAFDIARDLPLPLMAYHEARGDLQALDTLVSAARKWDHHKKYVYSHSFLFLMMTLLQRIAGTLTAEDFRKWMRWYWLNSRRYTDAVADKHDKLPRFVDVFLHLTHYVRHPRSFLHSIVLNK